MHVLARLLDVLSRIAEVERLTDRVAVLRRHADLALASARRDIADPNDLADFEERHGRFVRIQEGRVAT